MNQGSATRKVIRILVGLAILSSPLLVSAMSSASYIVDKDSLNTAGARSSSASFEAVDTIGEVASGYAQSSSFASNLGFQGGQVNTALTEDVSSPSSGGSSGGSALGLGGHRRPSQFYFITEPVMIPNDSAGLAFNYYPDRGVPIAVATDQDVYSPGKVTGAAEAIETSQTATSSINLGSTTGTKGVPFLFTSLGFLILTLFLVVRGTPGKLFFFYLALVALFISLGFFLVLPLARAAVNAEINYQGHLLDSSSEEVPDGSYNMRFKLYTTLIGGSAIWTETDTGADKVSITDGLFSLMLGSTTPFSGVDFNQTLYLGMEVGGTGSSPSWDGEMTPRKVVGVVPAALVADTLDNLDSLQFVRSDTSGTLTGSLIITGNATTTNFFATTASSTSLFSTSFNTGTLSVTGGLSTLSNLLATGSSTLQNFTFANATGTNATTTNFFATTASSTSLFSSLLSIGGNTLLTSSSHLVGIGTSTPGRKLNVLDAGSNAQLRLSQSGSIYGELYVDASGDLQISATGGSIRFNDNNLWVCSGGSCGASTPAGNGNAIVETGVIFNNNFTLKQIDASTTNMYDSATNIILQFDEAP